MRVNAAGELEGDMFDGEGFVRGIKRKGFDPSGASALVIGSGYDSTISVQAMLALKIAYEDKVGFVDLEHLEPALIRNGWTSVRYAIPPPDAPQKNA